MPPLKYLSPLTTTICLLLAATQLWSATTVPSFFSDNMVLQHGNPVHIWGWEDHYKEVIVTIGEHTQTGKVKDGQWSVTFPNFEAGGCYTLRINGSDRLVLDNITFGDVYLISGQSNMELQIRRVLERYPNAAQNSQNPNIRLFRAPTQYQFTGKMNQMPSGKWLSADPQNTGEFSAIGYFFAKYLQQSNGIPIGIISTAIGGSPIESWLDKPALHDDKTSLDALKPYLKPGHIEAVLEANKAIYANWENLAKSKDLGLNSTPTWHSPETDIQDWSPIDLPGVWQTDNLKEKSGVFWFRKSFVIPENCDLKDAKLYLGVIVDADTTFINGQKVGNITYRYPPRIYTVPEAILKHGRNTLTTRIEVHNDQGEFIVDKDYQLQLGDTIIPLSGEWKYQVGCLMEKREATTFVRWKPTGLYNGMIAPFKNLGLRGVLWYQGESNAGRPSDYAEKLSRLVHLWRKQFETPELPFFYVQLANYMDPQTKPETSGWAELREQQRQVELAVPNTHMAVAIDLGEWNDIHPLNKKDLAERLAKMAEAIIYEKNVVCHGPKVTKAVPIEEGLIQLHFQEDVAQLVAKAGEQLYTFEVAGEEKSFVSVTAKLGENNSVILHSSAVENPKWVRYAWANNPAKANLYNTAGFPASPFEIPVSFTSNP